MSAQFDNLCYDPLIDSRISPGGTVDATVDSGGETQCLQQSRLVQFAGVEHHAMRWSWVGHHLSGTYTHILYNDDQGRSQDFVSEGAKPGAN